MQHVTVEIIIISYILFNIINHDAAALSVPRAPLPPPEDDTNLQGRAHTHTPSISQYPWFGVIGR